MKKLIISMLLVAFSVTVMATVKTDVKITLSGSNPIYSLSTVRLIKDDARTAEAEGGYDAPCMMVQSNDNSTLIYGMISGSEYSTVIGFTTNNVDDGENAYSLTFEDFSGDEFFLYDLVANKKITVNGSTPVYKFSAASGRVAVKDRFVVNYVPADPSALEACFINNHLTISTNPWPTGKIAVYDGETKKVEEEGTKTDIDLTGLTAGKHYTVKFFPTTDITGEPAKTLIIVPVTLP